MLVTVLGITSYYESINRREEVGLHFLDNPLVLDEDHTNHIWALRLALLVVESDTTMVNVKN